MNTNIRRIGALLAVGALATTLAACSGGQSVADACKIANDTMTKVSSDTQTATQQFMQDMTSGGEPDFNGLFGPINEALESAQSEITNEEVSEALDQVATEFNGLSSTLEGFEMPDMSSIDPSDPAAMAELEKMQTEAQELSTDITDQAQKLTEASTKLQEVCSAG